MKVAILGSGPSGLLSAWACMERGLVPVIYTRDRYPSVIRGAQYLHEPIPGVTDAIPFVAVTYIKRGTAEGYAYKVYRDMRMTSSWDRWPQGVVTAWPLGLTYERLWKFCEDQIWDGVVVDHEFLNHLVEQNDLVISTIPPAHYCQGEHVFTTAKTWIREEADSLVKPWTIVYDGTKEVRAHRLSNLEGRKWNEYGVSVWGAAEVLKPQYTDCDCFTHNILRVGRFGLWRRDVLTTDAYREVTQYLLREL